MMPEAVLFDMDGTLTDTEKLWFEAEEQVFAELGCTWQDGDQNEIIGMAIQNSTALLVKKFDLTISPEELADLLINRVVQIAQTGGMPWRPGARELLENLTSWGIPTALVTSSYKPFADLALANAPQGSLTVSVTGDRVAKGKPDPEPYLTAADELGVDITACVAFEDSGPGLTSAYRSGAKAVGIPFQVELPVFDGALYIDTLEGLDKEFFDSLI